MDGEDQRRQENQRLEREMDEQRELEERRRWQWELDQRRREETRLDEEEHQKRMQRAQEEMTYQARLRELERDAANAEAARQNADRLAQKALKTARENQYGQQPVLRAEPIRRAERSPPPPPANQFAEMAQRIRQKEMEDRTQFLAGSREFQRRQDEELRRMANANRRRRQAHS
jgi:hypothetical protein